MAVAIQHPVLQDDAVQFRGYQANLARIASQRDTLVVLPTGMGKTIVALLCLADAWQAGARRILVMAPTRPLVEQHAAFLGDVLAPGWGGSIHALTGNVRVADRAGAYQRDGIVVATPQVVQNDLIAGHLEPPDWVVYDECHRAVGEYAYTFIGDTLRHKRPDHRRLGLTASPGHDVEKIHEVCHHLGLGHVEIRTPTDPDVAEYVQDVDMQWETLPFPPNLDRVRRDLEDALGQRVRALKASGLLRGAGGRPTKRALLEVARDLQRLIKQTSDPDPAWFQGLSLQAQAMKIHHALEQVQTQGAAAFVQYMDDLRKDAEGPKASKANRVIADDHHVNRAYQVSRHDDSENPKMGRVEELVREQLERAPDSRVIVFTHYRATCEQVAKRLAALPGIEPVVFVGQGKRRGKDGLSQKQQAEILQQFRHGTYNTLVATSVAEEGLDIPATDLVVFYEPVPSEIRAIQRRGRTGRNREGRVIVLMTKGTADEAAHWSARRKEQAMVRELHGLRAALSGQAAAPDSRTPGQARLDPAEAPARPTDPGSPLVICDSREQPGGVVRHLHQMGLRIEARNLEIADFVLSDRVAVERKADADFVESLIDGRLFDQLKRLKEYPRPYLVLEGDGLMGHRNVSPEAIMGALASVSVDYGIPILQTRDALETARFLAAVAKREQTRGGRHVAVRAALPGDDDGAAVAVLAGFPGISQVRAGAILRAFGSLQAVFDADVAALAAVEGMGPQTARRVHGLLQHRFQD